MNRSVRLLIVTLFFGLGTVTVYAAKKSTYGFYVDQSYSPPGARVQQLLGKEAVWSNLSDSEKSTPDELSHQLLELHFEKVFEVELWVSLNSRAEEFWESLLKSNGNGAQAAREAYFSGKFSHNASENLRLSQQLQSLREDLWSFLLSTGMRPATLDLRTGESLPKLSPFLNQLLYEAWALTSFYEDVDTKILKKLKIQVIHPNSRFSYELYPDGNPYRLRVLVSRKINILWELQGGDCGQNGLWPRASLSLVNFWSENSNSKVDYALFKSHVYEPGSEDNLMRDLRTVHVNTNKNLLSTCDASKLGTPFSYYELHENIVRFYRYLALRR